MFLRLNDVGFDGAILIEAYRGDYGEKEELIDSLKEIEYLSKKYIKR